MAAVLLHDAAQLLAWVDELYSWFDGNRRLRRGRIEDDQLNIQLARMRFPAEWPTMLPFEREETVDLLLAAFCRVCLWETFDFKEIKYAAIVEETGVRGERQRSDHYVARRYELILMAAQRIRDWCLKAGGEPYRAAVAAWEAQLFGPYGLTRLKVARLGEGTPEADVDALEKLAAHLAEEAAGAEGIPPVQSLPNAEHILPCAQIKTQSAEDRFHSYSLLIDDLTKLYSPRNTTSMAAPQQQKAQARDLTTALCAFGGGQSLEHFERLPLEQQEHAVWGARNAVSETCKQLERELSLPDATELISRTLAPLLSHPAASGRASSPIVLESLGRRAAHCAVLAREVQRCDGTMRRAWGMRRRAGGL